MLTECNCKNMVLFFLIGNKTIETKEEQTSSGIFQNSTSAILFVLLIVVLVLGACLVAFQYNRQNRQMVVKISENGGIPNAGMDFEWILKMGSPFQQNLEGICLHKELSKHFFRTTIIWMMIENLNKTTNSRKISPNKWKICK